MMHARNIWALCCVGLLFFLATAALLVRLGNGSQMTAYNVQPTQDVLHNVAHEETGTKQEILDIIQTHPVTVFSKTFCP